MGRTLKGERGESKSLPTKKMIYYPSNLINYTYGVTMDNEVRLENSAAEPDNNENEGIDETMANENPNLTNEIKGIDMESLLAHSKEMQEKAWAREDQIRKETQAREDNAISRKVADMRKAGVNPNIAYSMSGAESGGGITTATGLDTSLIKEQMSNMTSEKIEETRQEYERLLKEYEIAQEQAFNGDENAKDRANKIFTSLLSAAAIIGAIAVKAAM